MDYKLSVEGYPLNHIALNLGWSSNKDTLGQSLSFQMPFDVDNTLFPKEFINPGAKVTLRYKSKVIFYGIVVDEDGDGRKPRKYTCFDFGFHLNKSEITIQFNNKTASAALEEICKKFSIKCTITNIPVKIKKIYKGEVVSEVIKDILEIAEQKNGKKYRFEMRGDTFTVFHWRDMHLKVNIEWIQSPKRKRSIENMRNSVEVVSDDEKKTKVYASVKDAASIKKYGLLTKVETIDDKEKAKAKNVADNLLKKLNKIQEEGSVSLLGNYEARAGRLLTLDEPITGLKGDYFIADVQHTISNGIHLMTLGLEVE